MKREAVQEERQRGVKTPSKTEEVNNPTSSVRDLTIDRIMEAEYQSEQCADKEIAYLGVGQNTMIPGEYKVNVEISIRLFVLIANGFVLLFVCLF